jgi:hypothetical protein
MSNDVSVGTIALTTKQKLLLAGAFVPVVFFALAGIFILLLLSFMFSADVLILLLIFLLVILSVIFYDFSKNLRDLFSGVAIIEEDKLSSLRRAHSRSSTCFGTFARLGELRMTPISFEQAQIGQTYRICYSPASGIVWSLEANSYG